MRYFHHRPVDPTTGLPKRHGGTTVGYVPVPGAEGKKYIVTFARCSEPDPQTGHPGDEFNKMKAHAICLGRFAKGIKMKELVIPEGVNKFEIFISAIAQNDKEVKERYGKKYQT